MPNGTCSVDGCGKSLFVRGWCAAHYHRWWRHGDPLAGRRDRGTGRSICSMDGCERAVSSGGLCRKHHDRVRRTGNPLGVTTAERFWSKVDIGSGLNACWHWTGSVPPSGRGYGVFKVASRKTIRPHRWAWEQINGRVPDGLQLDHVCHTRDLTCGGGAGCLHRRCVNPAHLEPVTPEENTKRGIEQAAARKRIVSA